MFAGHGCLQPFSNFLVFKKLIFVTTVYAVYLLSNGDTETDVLYKCSKHRQVHTSTCCSSDIPVYFIVKASSKYILKIRNITLTSIKYNAFMYITNSNTVKHS